MKILKNNYNNYNEESNIEETKKIKPYPRKCICENCQSELQYDKTDITIGFLGAAHIHCPLCNNNIILEDNEHNITLTKDNIKYPNHFWHTSVETGAVNRNNNEEIKKEINNAIEYFRKYKDEYHWYTESGSLNMVVYRLDDDKCYEIMVTNNFYSTSIPFEDEDY